MVFASLASLTLSFVLSQAPVNAKTAEPAPPPIPTGELAIETGKIRGTLCGKDQDIAAYRGIPFAAPPVGDLRWKAPQPAAKWEGVRDCFQFGNTCPQKTPKMMAAIPQMAINGPYEEDCLYLNVWGPANPQGAKLPVLYWIHGGGYTMGAASQPIYDGEELARVGCIVVSINYRLGPFGFLAHPALSKESPTKSSGNYGLLDQIAGLQWVQRNITAFGGDPAQVAIFGESAGGGSVLSLLVSPMAKGLFRAAISQSAPEMNLARLHESHRGHEAAEALGVKLIALCGLSESATVDEMRNLQADVMVQTFPSLEVDNKKFDLELSGMRLPIAPIIDGHVIPNDPNLILAAGAQNPVPLIIGNTRDEMNLFMVMTRTPAKVEDYVKEIQDDFGHLTDAIVDAYPAKNSKEIRSAIVQLTGDVMFVSQARYTARQHSAVQPTFRYEFSLGSKQGFLRALGAHHASELAYLFQRPAEPDDNDRNVAKILGRYWINLAATGNPNGDGLPTWPAYNRDSEEMINFEKGVEVLKGHRNRQLDAIDIYLRDVNAKESAAK